MHPQDGAVVYEMKALIKGFVFTKSRENATVFLVIELALEFPSKHLRLRSFRSYS